MLFLFFAGGLLGAVLLAWLARWIASAFVADAVTPIAAFAFTLGAIGTRGVSSDMSGLDQALGLGGLLGLAIVWWWFFRWNRVAAE